MLYSAWFEILIAVGLLAGLATVVEVGFRFGRRHRDAKSAAHLGTVQGALLGLLALLLGFAFSGATSRFIEHQDVLLREANAIGTAFLRADLLPPSQRDAVKDALRRYTEQRIMLHHEVSSPDGPAVLAIRERLQAEQDRMWEAAVAGAQGNQVLVIPPINEVIDLLATRDAAVRRHLPVLVLALLIACAAMSVCTVGYGHGLALPRVEGEEGRGRGYVSNLALSVLIAASLWVTIDMDYPRRGLIRLDAQPLLDVKEAMRQVN